MDRGGDINLVNATQFFDSLGELTGWTDAKGQSFGLTYDALSRVTARSEAEGTTTWTWGTSAGSHNIGKLASVSMSGYSENLTYDSKGRVSVRSITTDQSYAIDYAYNAQGQPDTLTWPISTSSTRVKVKYGYGQGNLESVTDYTSGSAGTVYWKASAQDARGQVTQETLGNGVVTSRFFDVVTGRVSSIQSGVGGGSGLQNESYLYDLVGNVTQRQNSNSFERFAAKTQKIGMGIEVFGAGAALFGLALDGVGALPGPGVMAFDGVVAVASSGLQVMGGVGQLWDDGDTGRQNIYAGATNIAVAGIGSWVGSGLMRSGTNCVARDANVRVHGGLAGAGGAIDIASDELPNMSPAVASCGDF